jgi:transposase
MDKVLQGANIKLSSVISTTDTVTEMSIIQALANGESDTSALAELAKGTLVNKKQEIKQSLNGLVGDHQKLLLKSMYNNYKQFQDEIAIIEAEIEKRMEKDIDLIGRLDEIPGVGKTSAHAIIAEIGTDMDQFPDAAHLASWAGVCPGKNESAGKRKNGKTKKKGNSMLKKTLVQCAKSASHSKNSYLSAQFKRIAARRGRNQATVAVAHSILTICYCLILTGAHYEDLGSNYFDKRNKWTIAKHSIKRLEALGYTVTVTEKSEAAEAS